MPLPLPNQPWPPKDLARVHNDVAKWSAWMSGDPDELSRVYGGDYGNSHGVNETTFRTHGVAGLVQRFFWGNRTRPGEQRHKLHVPVAAEIAQVSADLVFGQPPTLTIADDDATQARLDELIGERGGTQLHDAAEACAGLGHVYLRVGWDKDIDPTGPLLSIVDADAAIPVYSYGRLQEVTFVREWEDSGAVLRHMECHESGLITHAAYLGDWYNIGRAVPLSAHPQTMDVIDDGMFADDTRNGSSIPTGLDRLDVVGVANQRSFPWRRYPAAMFLGAADISGVESDLDALDRVWSSWMKDIRLGQARIHVPAHMLDNHGLGKGASFDLDRELYQGLQSPPDGALQLQETQFAIRHEEHAATASALLERIVGGAGYSLQTFGLDQSTSTQTATESWARQNRTQNTRNAKLRRWTCALRELAYILLAVDRAQFGGSGNPEASVDVEFADTVSESQLVRAQTAAMLRSADAASTRTLVELVHNDWDGEQIDEEVALIEGADQAAQIAPPAGTDQSQMQSGQEPNLPGHTGLDVSGNTDTNT